MGQAMSDSWKLTLPCTRAEAEWLHGEPVALDALDPMPVLVTNEPDAGKPEDWRLEAYFEEKPAKAAVVLIQSLIPSARGAKPLVERVVEEDWVTVSQSGLEPVRAGRFFVATDAAIPAPAGSVNFVIPASRAFGTGSHQTTAGCLMMLDRMKRIGVRAANICDVGTGTGLLAFAGRHLWPTARMTASDIDPVSIEVSAENAGLNAVHIGTGPGEVALFVAGGVDHEGIIARAPYDLIIANILAGPLIALAPSMAALIADGGTLVLAGLLESQADAVIAAYRRQGLRLADRIDTVGDSGCWPTLRLRKRVRQGWRRPVRWVAGQNGETPGYGSW